MYFVINIKLHLTFLDEFTRKRKSQSRQSARPFLQSFWDSPAPSPAGECAPPPHLVGGGGVDTRWKERGWRGPNSDEGTDTVVLYLYMYAYFVDRGLWPLLLKFDPTVRYIGQWNLVDIIFSF